MMFKKVVVLALMATSGEAFSPMKQGENRFGTTYTHNIPRYSGILDRNASLRMMEDSEQPPRKLSKKEESLLEIQESLATAEARRRKLEEDRLRIEQEMALAQTEKEALASKIIQLETKPDPFFNPAVTAAGFALPLAAAVAGRNALSSRPKVKIQKQQQQQQLKQQSKSSTPLGKLLGRNEVGGTQRVDRRDAQAQKKNRSSGTVPTAPKDSPFRSLLKKSRNAVKVEGTRPTAPKTTPFPSLLKKVQQSQEIQDEIAGVVQAPKTSPFGNLIRSKKAGIVKEAPKEVNILKAPSFNFMSPFENVVPPKPTSSGTRSIAEAKRRQKKVEKKSNPAVGGAVATAAAAAVIFSTAQGPGLSILKNVARVESPLNKAKTEKVEVATRKNAKKAAAETPESPSSSSAVTKKTSPETPPTTSVEKEIPLKDATVKASVPQEPEFTVNESLEAKLLANSKDMNVPAEVETAVPELQNPLESTVVEAAKVAEVTEAPVVVKELTQTAQSPTNPTSPPSIEQTSTLTASEPIKGSFGSTFAPTDVQPTTSTAATEIKPTASVAPEALEVPTETILPFAKPATPPLNPAAIAAANNDVTPPAPVSEVTSVIEVKPEAPVVELKAAELKPVSPIAEIKQAAPLPPNVAEIPKSAAELKPFVPVVPVVPIVPPKSESETDSSAPTVSSKPKEEVQKPALKVVSEVESPKVTSEQSLKVQTPNKEKLKDLTNPFAGSVLSPLKIVNEDPKPFTFPNPLQSVTDSINDVKKSLTPSSAETNEPSLQNKVASPEKSGSVNFLNPFSQRAEKESKAEVVAAPVPFETKNFLKSLSFNGGEDTSVKASPQAEKQGKGLSNFAVPIGGAAALTFAAVAVAVGVSDDDDEIIMEAPKMGGTYDGPFTQDAVYGKMNVQTNGAFVKSDKVKLNHNEAVKLNGPPTIGSTPAYEGVYDSSYLSSLKNGSTSPVGGGVPSYLDTLRGSTTVTGEGPISYLDRL